MSCTTVSTKPNILLSSYSFSDSLVKERRQLLECLVCQNSHISFYDLKFIAISCGGGCFLHMLASIPQSKNHVRCGHVVWRMDGPPSAGSACAIHGLRYNLAMCTLNITSILIGVFYYFNSILNPILYTILSKRFRRGFNDMTDKCWICEVIHHRFPLK